MSRQRIIVTGGYGFIGSALVRQLLRETGAEVLNVDKLTYAANLASIPEADSASNYNFVRADIADAAAMNMLLDDFMPDAILHLAAESHVDRSIDGPQEFIRTNIVGTFTLLQEALRYWRGLRSRKAIDFRFLHVSTDEVFGSLGRESAFTEESPYCPNSPYSASKASSDHLVRAWHHTYGFPALITNCSNNYGPYQFFEKLIPLMIIKGLKGEKLPVYGDGQNVRDWLYVEDHARALRLVLEKGKAGQTYNIGGNSEKANLEVVETICHELDRELADGKSRRDLISFVEDRPGHDKRYAIDASKIRNELGWSPKENFNTAIRKTVKWFIENRVWWDSSSRSNYAGERLGVLQTAEA